MKIVYSVSVQNEKKITTLSIKRASEIPLNLLVLSPLVHLDCPSQLSHQPLNTRFSFLLYRNNRKRNSTCGLSAIRSLTIPTHAEQAKMVSPVNRRV